METKERKLFLSEIPSWGLSLMTLLVAVILFVINPFGEEISYIGYDILIIIACFYICTKNPNSIWYTPFICNIIGIMAAFGEENFYWGSILMIIVCAGWILSLMGAIIGFKIGRRQLSTQNL